MLHKISLVLIITAFLSSLTSCLNFLKLGWMEEFDLAGRKLASSGEADFFILNPGFQTILASQNAKLTITVLDETKEINGFRTRVIEEKEEKDGELVEVSRNFLAIDQETGDVFYFGEEESSKIEPAIERKTYAPGIGLVQDQSLKLVSYGYVEARP